MKKLILRRLQTNDGGTAGMLYSLDGLFAAHTLELPDRDNAPDISRIPAMDYCLSWLPSNRLQRHTYRILDVPNRSGILFHPANVAGDAALGYRSELLGCIALGARIQWQGASTPRPQWFLHDSADTFIAFVAYGMGKDLHLQIIDEPPGQLPPEPCDEP